MPGEGPYRTCQQCRGESPADTRFCIWCGAPAATARPSPPPTASPVARRSVRKGLRAAWARSTPNERWITIGAIVAALIVGVAVWLAPIGPDLSREPETGALTVNEPAE